MASAMEPKTAGIDISASIFSVRYQFLYRHLFHPEPDWSDVGQSGIPEF
jgi:hypothetical protein